MQHLRIVHEEIADMRINVECLPKGIVGIVEYYNGTVFRQTLENHFGVRPIDFILHNSMAYPSNVELLERFHPINHEGYVATTVPSQQIFTNIKVSYGFADS